MSSFNQTPTNASLWKSFYNSLKEEAVIPSTPAASIDNQNAIFHEMYVNLAEVQSQLLKSSKNPLRTVIYCDVLNVPDGMKWTVNGNTLMIVARQIYWGKSSAINLDFRNNNAGALVVYADKHNGSGKYIIVSDPTNTTEIVNTDDYNSEGYLIKLKDKNVQKIEMKYDQGINDLVQDHFKVYLNESFLYGSVLFNLNENVALDIHSWVTKWARESLGLSGLFYRSAASSTILQSRINAKSKGARFVPRLSKTIYEQLSTVFVAAAQQYEDSYQKFIVGGKLTSQNLELAKTLKDNKQYESDYSKNLLSQALVNFQRARRTQLVAQYAFNAEQLKADIIKNRFENEGVRKYVRDAILKAILGMVMSIATVVAAVASMAAGNVGGSTASAGAASAAAGAASDAADALQVATDIEVDALVESVNAASAAAQAAEDGRSVMRSAAAFRDATAAARAAAEASQAAGAAAELAAATEATAKAAKAVLRLENLTKSLKNLKEIIEILQKSVLASFTIFNKASSLAKGGPDTSATDKEYSNLKELLSKNTNTTLSPSEAWDAFLIEFDLSMEFAINADDGKGIDFAADYKAQVHRLAIFGKSLAKAQEGVIQTSNKISAILLQRGLLHQQNKRLEQYVNNVSTSEAEFVDMQQIFYGRLLDMKGNLFSALQNYKDTYYYWALKESVIQPSILSSVKDIGTGIEDIAKIKIDQESAFKSFSPAPGPFQRKEIKITDQETLASLKNNHSVTIPVGVESNVFKNLERVRFDNIQVWLDGASHENDVITIDIVCSGVFVDTYKGKHMSFISEPLEEKFQYRTFKESEKREDPDFWLNNNTVKAFSEHDARITDEMKFAYAMPTPFTEWTIDVDPKKNDGVSLENLNAIIIIVEGSAI